MMKRLKKLAIYLDEKDLNKEAGDITEIMRVAQLFERAPFDDNVKVAASYPGNMGAIEMFSFYQKDATPSQKNEMDNLLDKGETDKAWNLLKQVTGVDLVDPPEHGQEESSSSEEDGIANAVSKILKPGFDILGHGTSLSNAELILKNGFSLRGHALNSTFLSMSADGSMPIAEQLKWWPYGEASQGETVGVAIMRLPKDMITKHDSTKLTEMVSVEPKVAPQPQEFPQQDGPDIMSGTKSLLPRKRNFDETRTIPSFFFFALWDEDKKSLVLNSNYDEAKILEHLSLDESAIAAPEPTQPLPTVTVSPEDSDFDVF
jgi:hypothetical protein